MNPFHSLDLDENNENQELQETNLLLEELKEYEEFIQKNKSRFDPFLKEKYLSQQLIRVLFEILNESYGFINYVNQNYDYMDNIDQFVEKMVNGLDYFYHKMNKYQDFLCSENGFNAVKEYGDLEDIDFYYNMAIVNKCLDYLYISLECSSDSLLNQVDLIYSNEPNRKKRFQTYFQLLFYVYKRKPHLLDTKTKNNLYRICKDEQRLKKEFKELTEKLGV